MSTERAEQLRRNPTKPERRMWGVLLPLRRQGYHFRRQVQIGPYYADFACHHARLVIEIDGITHIAEADRAHDRMRESYISARGFKILRFWNNEVLINPGGVYAVISAALMDLTLPTLDPSPQGGGRRTSHPAEPGHRVDRTPVGAKKESS